MPAQRYYDQQTIGLNMPSSQENFQENRLYLVPFYQWTDRMVLFSKMGMDLFRNTTGADVNGKLGVYIDDGYGLPGKKLHEDTIIFPNGGTGEVTTSTPFSLLPGLYWVAWIHDGNDIRLSAWESGGTSRGQTFLGDDNAGGSGSLPKCWGYRTNALFLAPLPESFQSSGLSYYTSNMPRICFKVA